MQEKLQAWYGITKEKWNNIERKQRIRLVAAGVAVLLALGLTVFFAFRTTMEEVTRMDNAVQREDARRALNAEGIRHDFRNGDRLFVEAGRMDEALSLLFFSEIMGPGDHFSMDNVMENIGMGTPTMLTRENLNLRLESALARMVERSEGVSVAVVQLSLPDAGSIWEQRNVQGTASVHVTSTQNRMLGAREGRAIAAMVSGSSRNLPIENVTVIDQNFNVLHSADMDNVAETRLSNISDFERAFAARVESQARNFFRMFDNNIHFVHNFDFDWEEVTRHMVEHFAPVGSEDGFVNREHVIRETMQNLAAGAPIGMEANDLITYMAGDGTIASSTYNEHTREWIFNTTVTEVVSNPGRFLADSSSMTAMAYRVVPHFQQELTDNGVLEELEMTWWEYQQSVPQWMPYDNPVMMEAYLRMAENAANALGINELTLEVFIYNDFIPTPDAEPLNIWLIAVLAMLFLFILLLAYGLIRRAQPDEIEEIEEPLTVEDMLATTQREEELERQIEAEKLRAIELGEGSQVMQQIEKFVDERPEAVAGLLRNWLNEEWE